MCESWLNIIKNSAASSRIVNKFHGSRRLFFLLTVRKVIKTNESEHREIPFRAGLGGHASFTSSLCFNRFAEVESRDRGGRIFGIIKHLITESITDCKVCLIKNVA